MRTFTLGPFAFAYSEGSVRYITWHGIELARRIYFAIRDANWGTWSTRITHEEITEFPDEVTIQFEAREQGEERCFAWTGKFALHRNGHFEFGFVGKTNASFLSNRLGLCLLHAPQAVCNRRCTVWDAAGTESQFRFNDSVHPENPATDICALAYPVDDHHSLSVKFEGEAFEIEDQRNWIDDSFKTFCRPLSAPRPYLIAENQTYSQRIGFEIHSNQEMPIGPNASQHPNPTRERGTGHPNPTRERGTGYPNPTRESGAIKLEVDHTRPPVSAKHRIGTTLPISHADLTAEQINLLKAVAMDHLRLEVNATNPAWVGSLQKGLAIAATLDCQVELAIVCTHPAQPFIDEVIDEVKRSHGDLARCLVHSACAWVTPAALIDEAVACFAVAQLAVPLFVGTLANFAELNRQRPDAEAVSGLCFSAQPQEHASDNHSLIETPAALASVVRSARAFAPAGNVVVGPITLRKRVNPYGAAIEELHHERCPTVDLRQTSLLGAGWTLACLKHLAEQGALASTWYEPVGWKGFLACEETGQPQDAVSTPSRKVYPIYHVLADWCELPAVRVIPCRSTDRLKIESVVLASATQTRLMLANLTDHLQRVTLPNQFVGGWARVLDESRYTVATNDPMRFRGNEQYRQVVGNQDLELKPYGFITITCDCQF